MKIKNVQWALVACVFSTTALGADFGGLAPALVFDTLGVGAREVRAADLNGDGILDLVTVNGGSDNVSIFFGIGDGTFSPPVHYPVGALPQTVIACDIDGDGDIDLTVGNANTPSITVLVNDGTGVFSQLQELILPFGGPDGDGFGNIYVHTMADFDGDGDPDIVMAMLTPNKYVYVSNDGSGIFGSPQVFDETPDGFIFPNDLEPADFNGDGHIDLITIQGRANARVYLNNGDATFTILPDFPVQASQVVSPPADFNGDGILDIAFVNNQVDGIIYTAIGNGDGTFGPLTSMVAAPRPYAVTTADLNNDGVTDLISSHIAPSNTIAVWIGIGDGTFEDPISYPSGGAVPMSPIAADVNGDSMLDIVNVNFVGRNVNVFLNLTSCTPDLNGDGSLDFFDISQFIALFIAGDPAADFTGDGLLNFFDVSEFLMAFNAGCP